MVEMLRDKRSSNEVATVEVIADFIEKLGAPLDLVVDWIIIMDGPELFESIEPRRRKVVLKAAKRETARRYIALRIEDAVSFVDMDTDLPDHADLDALKKAAVLTDIADVVESTNVLRAHRANGIQTESYRRIRDAIGREHAGGDCFDEDVRKQYLRIAARELPELFGSRAARGEIDDRMGLVYMISLADPALVKIGFTTRIEHRMRAFRTATPGAITVHLTIEGPSSLEATLHRRFEADCVGREWFRLSDEIKAFIKSQKAKSNGNAEPTRMKKPTTPKKLAREWRIADARQGATSAGSRRLTPSPPSRRPSKTSASMKRTARARSRVWSSDGRESTRRAATCSLRWAKIAADQS